MADRLQFKEKLAGVLALAEDQNGKITVDEVEKYFEEDGLSQEDIERLGKRMAELEAEYSENPAYMAWVHQQYLEQKWKVKKNETNK